MACYVRRRSHSNIEVCLKHALPWRTYQLLALRALRLRADNIISSYALFQASKVALLLVQLWISNYISDALLLLALSAVFQLLSRLYVEPFSVVSTCHEVSRSCASCPQAQQRHFSSILKSLARLWLATTSASSLAIAQVARQLPISLCRCLGVFGIISTPPGSNRPSPSVPSFWDTSHVTHRQFWSVNSCLQFGQIYFDLHGGFDTYLLDLEDCCIMLQPSFMSSQYQHLPHACTRLQ